MKFATIQTMRVSILSVFVATLAMPLFGATCNVSTTGVSMGIYTPNQAVPLDSVGSLIIECAKGVLDALPLTVNYAVEIGRGASSTYLPREMTSGAAKLRYNLYRDASRFSVWGNTTGGTANVTGTLQLQFGIATASHSIYGRIFGGQNAVPGAYSDAILVTVVY